MKCSGPISSLSFGVLVWLFDARADPALCSTLSCFVESSPSQTLIVHVMRNARGGASCLVLTQLAKTWVIRRFRLD
jgi:hypothetical protein